MSGSANRGLRNLVAGVVVCAAGAVAAAVLYDVSARPITSVNVSGPFEHVDRAELEAAVAGTVEGGFFGADVEAISAAAHQLAWVRAVRVRLVWPDSLNIVIEERTAVARWSEKSLLETDGSVFTPSRLDDTANLPRLDGPPGTAKRVLGALRSLQPLTEGLIGGGIRALQLTGRGDWYATLDSGLELVMDRPADDESLRYVLPALGNILGERLVEVERIDMRYAHGFAVRWRAAPADSSATGDEVADGANAEGKAS